MPRGDRGFESRSLQRRVSDESDLLAFASLGIDAPEKRVLAFEEVCGEAVAQRVWRHALLDPGGLGGGSAVVPAGSGNCRVVDKALTALPGGIAKIYLRGDGALYEHELMGLAG
jgi:hypothetical protein